MVIAVAAFAAVADADADADAAALVAALPAVAVDAAVGNVETPPLSVAEALPLAAPADPDLVSVTVDTVVNALVRSSPAFAWKLSF